MDAIIPDRGLHIVKPRSHNKPRFIPDVYLKAPLASSSRLGLLNDARTTHLVYGQLEHTTAHYDEQRLADAAHRLPRDFDK